MTDRRMPEPRSPFTEAHREELKENARKAEDLYNAPDRQEVTEANKALKEKAREGNKGRPEGPGADPVVTENVRKPF